MHLKTKNKQKKHRYTHKYKHTSKISWMKSAQRPTFRALEKLFLNIWVPINMTITGTSDRIT